MYSFHNVPVRVNQSKLVQGISMKEFSELYVTHNIVFGIKYSFHNESIKIDAGYCNERILKTFKKQKYVFFLEY